MSYFERSEHSITSRPMPIPYDISSYRLDWKRAAAAAGAALGALLIAYLLLALAGALAEWSLLAAGAAAAGALAAVGIAGVACWLQISEWRDHRAMLWELHSSYLDSIEQHGAQETTETASQIVTQIGTSDCTSGRGERSIVIDDLVIVNDDMACPYKSTRPEGVSPASTRGNVAT